MILKEKIKVGIIQTLLDSNTAWAKEPKMERNEENIAIKQIKKGFRNLKDDGSEPDIVILPELSVPRGYVKKIVDFSSLSQCIVIAGIDYKVTGTDCENEAVVIVPSRMSSGTKSPAPQQFWLKKTYPAPLENKKLEDLGYKFKGSPEVPIFDAGEFGNFGVAVCYDLTDVQRLALYRGQLHNLFIVAYNRDLTSFRHIAEAAMRLNFHNVIICNTGFFGGSICVSPYYEAYHRQVFESKGPNLFLTQVFDVELRRLADAQTPGTLINPAEPRWKALPPGYKEVKKLFKIAERIS